MHTGSLDFLVKSQRFETCRRQPGASTSASAAGGDDQRFLEGLIHGSNKHPRPPVGHAEASSGIADRAGVLDQRPQVGFARPQRTVSTGVYPETREDRDFRRWLGRMSHRIVRDYESWAKSGRETASGKLLPRPGGLSVPPPFLVRKGPEKVDFSTPPFLDGETGGK